MPECKFPIQPACDHQPFFRGVGHKHYQLVKSQIGEGKKFADWTAAQAAGLVGSTADAACESFARKAPGPRAAKPRTARKTRAPRKAAASSDPLVDLQARLAALQLARRTVADLEAQVRQIARTL